jgi:outer membrane receptor protein involved in Fe transport
MTTKAKLPGIRNEILILISAFFLSFAPMISLADESADDTANADKRVTELEQAATDQAVDDEGALEEVVVTGSQIKGAAISDALAVSVTTSVDIEALGIGSADELFDSMPELGQNFFNDAETISGGVNAARGDIGAINMRNMDTGNTLVLMNGRRMVNAAGYQTEVVGGSFVPVSTVNSNSIPVFGVDRVEVLRDGASAIYGADAVAGVINTVLKKDFEGLSVQGRYGSHDGISRDDQRINIEWGKFFNEGRTNVGLFADYYSRDRVNSQDDPRWADPYWPRQFIAGTAWEGRSDWDEDSANSLYGQFDFRSSANSLGVRHLTDSAGEWEAYPLGSPECSDSDAWVVNEYVCATPDPGTRPQGASRYNLNENRDLRSELKRYNMVLFINHELENGLESFTEMSWYEAETNMLRHPSIASSGAADLQVGPLNYYNPFGPCGSPNRLPDEIIGTDVPCSGTRLEIDNYRFAEFPRIVDTDNHTYRFLQGFRGSKGAWDWETALTLSKAERNDVTHNRVSNTLMQIALDDPTPAAYNPFSGGVNSNIERALVDVYRYNESELQMIDFKFSNGALFEMPAGPVGFLGGFEFRRESFIDDRDPRLDGTIVYTAYEGATYPFVSDVANSSPTSDSRGDRNVTSFMGELALPILDNLDVQVALRYEDFSDVGDTTVGKVAFGWRPIDSLLVRGSWSEAFRAPNLITVNEDLVVRSKTRVDTVCTYVEDTTGENLDCSNSTQRRAQGSSNLVPEESTNTSVGLVWDATDNLTFTIDYWEIEKDNTIGLFGEVNHTSLDLLYLLREGIGNCASAVGNPAVIHDDPDDDVVDLYLASGVCPQGDALAVNDSYDNLDTRTMKGHDIGIYYDLETDIGDFNFKWNASFYDEYTQIPGGLAKELLDAVNSGELDAKYGVNGFNDLIGMDGRQDEKHAASVRWSKNEWGGGLSMNYLSDFYDSSQINTEGVAWVIDSMTTYNAYADFDFDMFEADSRVRLGVRNLTDERAPVAEKYFHFWSDAHRDSGRYVYLDLKMKF